VCVLETPSHTHTQTRDNTESLLGRSE